MNRLRIYALFGDAGRYAGQVSRAESHEIHFSSFSFDDLIQRTGGKGMRVRRRIMDRVLAEMEGFDAVFSDSPDLVLLHYVRRKRGLRPIPWLVNEVDLFRTAGLVRRLVQDHYREDPLPGALGAREVVWFTITPGLEARYRRMGIPRENLFYLPLARSSIRFFLPELVRLQDEASSGPGRSDCPIPPDAILALGSHERDYDCLAAALAGTGLVAEVICDFSLYPDRPCGPLRWHDSLPAPAYVEAIRRASMVILPLRDVGRALGQLSCALPMRLAKAVIATDAPSLAAHLQDGECGLAYPAGDAAGLRDCILRLASDLELRARLGKAAARREKELSEIAEAAIEKILQRLSGGA